jgi:hypothetical protein
MGEPFILTVALAGLAAPLLTMLSVSYNAPNWCAFTLLRECLGFASCRTSSDIPEI